MYADAYRSKAAECLLIAETLSFPDGRTRWLAMAQAWNRLADDAERMAIYGRLDGEAVANDFKGRLPS
jgi:hypothetical protein